MTTHHYEYVYGQIVGPIRFEKINFLEIGLGCGMGYGPGKSIPVWKEFMPNATISILEYNGACAKPFESQVKQLFVGDQSDLSLMKQIGEFCVFFIFIDRRPRIWYLVLPSWLFNYFYGSTRYQIQPRNFICTCILVFLYFYIYNCI